MKPGNPEDQIIDNIFETAWKKAINRIGEIGGRHAKEKLNDLILIGITMVHFLCILRRWNQTSNNPRPTGYITRPHRF